MYLSCIYTNNKSIKLIRFLKAPEKTFVKCILHNNQINFCLKLINKHLLTTFKFPSVLVFTVNNKLVFIS